MASTVLLANRDQGGEIEFRSESGSTLQGRRARRTECDGEKANAGARRRLPGRPTPTHLTPTARRRLGTLAHLDAGTETLGEYVRDVWIPSYAAALSTKTQKGYKSLSATRLERTFGDVPLRDITTEKLGRWQAEQMRDRRGQVSAQKALTLLGNILQRAAEGGRVQTNPVRVVRKARVAKSAEAKPLAPSQVEAIRWAMLRPADV